MSEESEEIKTLTQHQLACVVWPTRLPKDNASYLNEFVEHIRDKFNETSSTKYSRELQEFTNLRNIALSTLSDNSLRDANSLKALKRYYCQLLAMMSRFKDSKAIFPWKDAFGRNVSNEGNLEFEMNNIMYNIASLHNELGSKTPRTNEQSTKEACLHFNNALWWVTELRDNRTGLKPKELGHDILTFYHHLLKAQAQECILLHSIRNSMKPENVSKIAAQIASDYEIASKLACSPLYTDPIKEIIAGAAVHTQWRITVEFKHKYFSAITYLLMGLSYSDDTAKEIGFRVARLKQASQYVESCKKLTGDTIEPTVTKTAFSSLEILVNKKLEKAVRYNDNVYHSSIPARETLPQPTPMLLASAIPFSMASFSDFKDLFSGLVTIESVQVNSIYSQKKDDLSRRISRQVEEQDEELAQMMSTLNIDKKSLRLPPPEAPDDLIEICAELSMNPNIVDDILTKLEEIDDKSEEIQKMLDSAESMLKTRPHPQYQDELNRLRKTHQDALRSNQSLHKQLYPELQQKIQLMATTDSPYELLPKVESRDASCDERTIRELEILLDRVDELKRERAFLLSQLRQSLNEDDVIKHVVAASSEQELRSMFENEIKKHNKYLEPLQNNLKQQNTLLDQIERLNAQYGQVKLNLRSQRSAQTEVVESFKKIYSQFKALSTRIDEGTSFHNQMLELVKNFYNKIRASNDLNDLLN